jgi:adenine/guanine phosphoribosyltransferase-like PRPP-binding protein
VDLVKQGGGSIAGVSVLIELLDLGGRAKLTGETVTTVLAY